jgi:hypothetical protein
MGPISLLIVDAAIGGSLKNLARCRIADEPSSSVSSPFSRDDSGNGRVRNGDVPAMVL